MRQTGLVVGVLVLAVAGCGSEVDVVGAGDTGAGGATTSTTTGTITGTTTSSTTSQTGDGGSIPGCSVETSEAPPYAVTFRLSSVDGLVFVRQDCIVPLTVTSCVDGYAEPLSIHQGCTVDCASEPYSCMACEPCSIAVLPVGDDQVVDVPWEGFDYSFSTNVEGCPCSTPHAVPAAHYRVSVPVYGTEEQALAGEPSWMAEGDFTLPLPGGVAWIALTGI